MKPIWEKSDDEFIKNNYTILGGKQCAERLGKTLSAVYSRATFLKIQKPIIPTKSSHIPKKIIAQIRIHAQAKNRVCSIDEMDIYNIWVKQNKKCALSGMYVQFHSIPKLSTASVDRIDSRKDYTLDNIQILHKDINLSKRIYTDEYYIYLCKLVAENNKNSSHVDQTETVWLDDITNDTIYPVRAMKHEK
jgi:hypothetical protein